MEQNLHFTRNSISIQKAFPEVYQRIFSHCAIVCSAPRIHAIAGDHMVPYGGVTMVRRATLRNYVGFEFVSKKTVHLAHYRVHVPDIDFIDHDFSRLFEERLVPVIMSFLTEKLGQKFRGIAVHIITEGSPPRITGGYGGVCAALAAALSLVVESVQSATLQQWVRTPTRELLTNTALGFDSVFRLALRLKAAVDLGIEGGGLIFASYISSISPTLFFWQKTFRELHDFFPPTLRALTFQQATRAFDHVPYWGANISELITGQIPFTWPVDALTINTGKIVSAGYAQRMLVDTETRFRHFYDELDTSFEAFIRQSDPLPPFYHLARAYEGEKMWEIVTNLSMKIALTTISRFISIFQQGVTDTTLQSFLYAADAYRHWLNILGINIPIQNRLANQLYNRASRMDVPIAVKPYAYGREIFLMAPLGAFRDAFIEEITLFQKETGIQCAFDYISWRDGFQEEGLRVEQDLQAGITASFLGGETTMLSRWDAQGEHEKMTVSFEQIATERTAADIFFDAQEKKIFVKGKALTSRELHSSTKAIEIMTALLEAGGAWVQSEALPQSSYIDRNEMQSKIVSPLRAIVKRRCKKELPLDIKGSVGNHFTMRFTPRGFTIALRVS